MLPEPPSTVPRRPNRRFITGYLYAICEPASGQFHGRSRGYGLGAAGTAEMMTKATAIGPSSVMVRSICGS
jgi:hypothetical protein